MMRRLIFSIILALAWAIGGTCLGDDKWHVPGADYRIQVRLEGSRMPVLLVRLPVEFQTWESVVCHGAEKDVKWRPVKVGEKLLAVEIIANGISSQTVYVYPSKAPSKPGYGAISPLPVACYYTGEKLVARPANEEGMRQCMLTHEPLVYYRSLPQFPVKTYGLHLFYKFQNTPENTNAASLKIRARMCSNLLVTTPSTLQFGLNNSTSGPWYMFVNGEPVFSWGNCQLENGRTPVSKELTLKPGLHKLDLFAYPGYGEYFPELRIRRNKGEALQVLPSSILFTSLECQRYRIDHRETPAICNFSLTRENHAYFKLSDAHYLKHQLVDLTPGRGVSYSMEKRPLTFAAGYANVNLRQGPSFLAATLKGGKPLEKLTFPVVGDTFLSKESIIRLRVTDMPIFEPVEKPLTISYGVTVDNGIDPLPPGAVLTVRTFFRSRKEPVSVTTPVPGFPNDRFITIAERDPDVTRLELELRYGGVTASNTETLHFVSPQAKLAFPDRGGRFLHFEDGYAILRRQAGDLKPDDVSWKGRVSTIAFADGFISNAKHPYDAFAFGDFDWGATRVQHLPVTTEADDLYLLDKFRALKTLDGGKVDMILFAPPMKEVSELDLRDLREQTLYLIRVVRTSGKQIGFVTPPALKELEVEKLRDYVLTLKELGRTFQFPVVDLYSASRGRAEVDAYWDWRAPEATPLRTAVPNAVGQRWALNQIKKVLENKTWK